MRNSLLASVLVVAMLVLVGCDDGRQRREDYLRAHYRQEVEQARSEARELARRAEARTRNYAIGLLVTGIGAVVLFIIGTAIGTGVTGKAPDRAGNGPLPTVKRRPRSRQRRQPAPSRRPQQRRG